MSLLAQSQKWYPTHVKVVVIRARGLRSKGKDGTNDAYAIMQLGKEKFSSSVAEKSVAPQWREEAEFELPALQSANQEKCTLYLIVMHRALVGLDKFLGQVAVNLNELYESKTRNKVGWYKLQSKNGKKEKERGEIEADIQFVRNNMTASMFDLSMKDKSRTTLGRLKDKFKVKKKDGFSDSASAIIPSLDVPGDSDDDTVVAEAADKKKKSKLKKLFPRSNLQRTSLSQSMSVIPTEPPSSPGNLKKAKNFEKEDFTEIQLHDSTEEETSSKTLYVPKIKSHKRAASADTKQLTFATPGNVKKDPLFLFGGLKPKSDPMSQSNLCINGSHVYTEEPGPATPARSRTDPKPLYSSQFYTSAEDLTGRSSADPPEAPGPVSPSRPSRGSSPGDQPSVSASPPDIWAEGSAGGDLSDPQRLDRVQEEKESQPLVASTGKKGTEQKTEASRTGGRSLNPFDDEVTEEEKKAPPVSKPEVLPKTEQVTKKEESRKVSLMSFFPRKTEAVKAPEAKESRNPFEEKTEEVKRPPSNSVWSNRTAAVKPKLEVSPKAETKAETFSPLVPPSPPLLSTLTHPSGPAPAVVGAEGATNSNFASLHVAYSPPAVAARSAPHSASPSMGESVLARLPALPSSSSSFSSRSSDTGGGDSSAADPAGGRAGRERQAPPRGSGRTSARDLLRELTGKNSSSNDGSPPDGEEASAAEVRERSGSPGDWNLRSSPECQSNGGDEAKNVTGELADSRAKECLEPKSSLHLPSSSPLLETNISANPPQVPPRSCPPDADSMRNPEPLATEVCRVPPTPAPRNFAVVTINNDPLCSPEEIPSQDLATSGRATDDAAEPTAEPIGTGGADFTPSAAETPNEESATGSWGDNDQSIPSVGSPDEFHGVSPPGTYQSGDARYPVVGSERETGRPGWLVAIPEKVEDSTGRRPATAGNTLRPGSPLPLIRAVGSERAGEKHGHTSPPPPPDPEPEPTTNRGTDLKHLGALHPEAMEESTGNSHGLRETSVRAPETDNKNVAVERSEASDETSMLGGKSENMVAPEDGQPIAGPDSSNLSRRASFSTHPTPSQSGEPTGERQSESRVTPPPTPARAPPLDPSAGPSLPSPLQPLLPQPPLLQSTPPPVTDFPCSVQPLAGNSPGAETSGTRRPAQARVSPTETQPIQSQGGGSAMSSRRRPHPVKPMSAVETKPPEVTSEEPLKPRYKAMDSMVTKSLTRHVLAFSESHTVLKDYDPSDPAAAYAQLTHDELIQLVLKQKEVISKKDSHVRELESYIDNLLVRVMEETPGILRISYQSNRQAERV